MKNIVRYTYVQKYRILFIFGGHLGLLINNGTSELSLSIFNELLDPKNLILDIKNIFLWQISAEICQFIIFGGHLGLFINNGTSELSLSIFSELLDPKNLILDIKNIFLLQISAEICQFIMFWRPSWILGCSGPPQ